MDNDKITQMFHSPIADLSRKFSRVALTDTEQNTVIKRTAVRRAQDLVRNEITRINPIPEAEYSDPEVLMTADSTNESEVLGTTSAQPSAPPIMMTPALALDLAECKRRLNHFLDLYQRIADEPARHQLMTTIVDLQQL